MESIEFPTISATWEDLQGETKRDKYVCAICKSADAIGYLEHNLKLDDSNDGTLACYQCMKDLGQR